jgi:hypothetical protein
MYGPCGGRRADIASPVLAWKQHEASCRASCACAPQSTHAFTLCCYAQHSRLLTLESVAIRPSVITLLANWPDDVWLAGGLGGDLLLAHDCRFCEHWMERNMHSPQLPTSSYMRLVHSAYQPLHVALLALPRHGSLGCSLKLTLGRDHVGRSCVHHRHRGCCPSTQAV